jgi:hypothetical protein
MTYNYPSAGSRVGNNTGDYVQLSKDGVFNTEASRLHDFGSFFGSFTFTSPIDGVFPAANSQYTSQTGYSTNEYVSNPDTFSVSSGIQTLKLTPATYRITAAGACHDRGTNTNIFEGQGAILRADFTLDNTYYIYMLVGQRNQADTSVREWTGGAGGSFVAYSLNENDLSNSEPLIIAGGGGLGREVAYNSTTISSFALAEVRGQMRTRGGRITGYLSTSNYATTLNDYGGHGAYEAHNASNGGTSAGFYTDGTVQTDTRSVPTSFVFNGITYLYNGAYTSAKSFRNGGKGGTFRNTSDTAYIGDGGFGCGGPGGWGGEGGGGGYSGGHAGRNADLYVTGGGGSFITNSFSPMNAGTSDGTWTVTGTYATHPTAPLPSATGLTTLGWNNGSGYITVERL